MKKIHYLLLLIIFLPACSFDVFKAQTPITNLKNQSADTNLNQLINSDNNNSAPAISQAEIMAAVKDKAPDWATDWQTRVPDFGLDNFKLVKSAAFEFGPAKDYEIKLSDLEKKFYAFSPDQTRYLDVYGDIVVYEADGKLRYENATVEIGCLSGDCPDPNYREAAIIDVTKSVARPFTSIPGNSYLNNSAWLSDQEFILIGNRVVTDQGLIPFVLYYNLQNLQFSLYEADLIPSCELVGNCPEDMMTLKVYYTGCPGRVTKEYERQVPKTTEVAKTALQELFYGPYGQEKEAGQEYIFEGPNYIILKDIKIIDNIAYVNLNDIRSLFSYDGFYTGLGGDSKRNCEEFSFFEQATKTLKQFPNIKDAVYFIEGDMSLFYAFLGINCPDGLCQNNPFQPTMDTVFIFNNECNDPVREYQRLIPKDSDRIKATLNELFKGPSKHEIQPGRYAMFNQWTANILKDIVIKNKIAYVNLADFRNWVTYPDWKCNFPQFFASVGATLTQFPGINDAIYFINGNQDTFYNYMNIKCPYEKECLYNPFK